MSNSTDCKILVGILVWAYFLMLWTCYENNKIYTKDTNELKQKYADLIRQHEDLIADKNDQRINRESDFIVVEPK